MQNWAAAEGKHCAQPSLTVAASRVCFVGDYFWKRRRATRQSAPAFATASLVLRVRLLALAQNIEQSVHFHYEVQSRAQCTYLAHICCKLLARICLCAGKIKQACECPLEFAAAAPTRLSNLEIAVFRCVQPYMTKGLHGLCCKRGPRRSTLAT